MAVKTRSKKRKRTPAAASVPYLPEEMVVEILARLPVKSLLRFKCVCRGWRAIISEPSFIRAHLRCSVSRRQQEPSILISPHISHGKPTKFSTHISFYQWEIGGPSSLARFMDARDFPVGREFRIVSHFAHCDGLVLAPTDTKLYLFNPATREAITLPDGHGSGTGTEACYSAGLGLDPVTCKYKVVRAFYRSMDPIRMGMEVFTVGETDACWRETVTDPLYPVSRWLNALTVNGGYLVWYMDRFRYPGDTPYGELLWFRLQDEAFGFTFLPDWLDTALDEVRLDVLHGELCILHDNDETKCLTIWTMSSFDDNSPWEMRYCLSVSGLCHPIGLLADGGILLWAHYIIHRYDLRSDELTTVCELDRIRYQGGRPPRWKNLFHFNVMPNTDSLVRITAA